jgi:hypothetical protein
MRVRARVGARRRVAVKTTMDDVSTGLSVTVLTGSGVCYGVLGLGVSGFMIHRYRWSRPGGGVSFHGAGAFTGLTLWQAPIATIHD